MSLSIEINGVPVNVTQGAGGAYFFQMAHMLRAAGLPEGLGFAMWAGANKSGYGTMSLDGVSMGHPVRFISVAGYWAYVARMRDRAESGSMDAKRRKDMRTYLRSLERCLSICEDWIRAREPVAEPGSREEPEPVKAPEPVEDPGPVEESEPAEGSEPESTGEPAPVAEPGPDPFGSAGEGPVRGPITEGPVPDAMMAALSAKLPLLCGIFGIGPELSREEQLLRILWLMAFHGRETMVSPAWEHSAPYGFRPVLPAGQMTEAAPLWGGHTSRDVEDLVKAAMLG